MDTQLPVINRNLTIIFLTEYAGLGGEELEAWIANSKSIEFGKILRIRKETMRNGYTTSA